MQFTNLVELEELAREQIDPGAFDYIAGGSDDELSMRRNRADFERLVLRPRVLIDVSNVDPSTTVLGIPVSMPVLLAPTAGHMLCSPDGEIATAQGADHAGTLMILSTLSNVSLEDVGAATAGPKWFQLYVYQDREVTRMLVQRAEAAGYQGLCLTVDVPYIGHRERDIRNAFASPYTFANFAESPMNKMPKGVAGAVSGLGAYVNSKWDPSLSWKDVEWLASITRLPVIVKGIMTGEDAVLAAEHGVKAIIVSNHGGRQLDSVESGISALPEVAEAIRDSGSDVEVIMDGGIRRGTDVLKALALDARAVLLGRPYLYGLALGGAAGVMRVLDLLKKEIILAMALSGRPNVGSIDASLVKRIG